MPTSTYTPLANLTLSTTATSVTFSSISQSYRDLVLIYSGSSSSGQLGWSVNGTSGIEYFAAAESNGSTTAGQVQQQATINQQVTISSNVQMVMNLFDYTSTDKHKSFLVRITAGSTLTGMYALRSATTSAVTSLKIQGVTFSSGASFALYGIAA